MGFKVQSVDEASKWADVCMVLVPDELQADLYNDFLVKNLKKVPVYSLLMGYQYIFS